QRVGLLLPVELHDLPLEALPVALVLLLQLLDLRLQRLHRPLGLDLLDEQREQQDPDGDDQEDDGQDPGPVGAEDGLVAEKPRPQAVPAEHDPRPGGVEPVQVHRAAPVTSVSRGGTGSYPPGWKGWQRSRRQTARPVPRTAPWRARASRAYALQEGQNRQRAGSAGLSHRRYATTGAATSRAGHRVGWGTSTVDGVVAVTTSPPSGRGRRAR